MDVDDSNPPYFQVSFSADPTKMPVISTDPDADLRERKEDSEQEVEKHPLSQQTTIDEDKIEKNPTPTKSAKRNKGKSKQPPTPVPVVDSDASLTLSELEDDDTELWLIAVPRHDSVRATLPGSTFSFPSSSPKSSSESPSKAKTVKREREHGSNKVGVLRGSYVYQEITSPESKDMRAVFVVKDESGKSRLEVAKPFARTINVAFDADMDESDHEAPIKTYPEQPEGLDLQYFPIGSKKRKVE